jgi:hypothetical protein
MPVQQLVSGFMLGGAHALSAIGCTLIFGVTNLLHLVHRELFVVSAHVGARVRPHQHPVMGDATRRDARRVTDGHLKPSKESPTGNGTRLPQELAYPLDPR